MTNFIDILKKIQQGTILTEEDAYQALSIIMSGEATDGQMGAFLMSLSQRGEDVNEIVGAARVMREKALSIKAPSGAVDCCGTGGDGLNTYNISTAVALVSAACGIPVAKHGNRSASSKSGAADVLEALGVNLDVPAQRLEEALQKFNFAFLMAPRHHQAMKHVVPVRKQLGFRTIFNLLGPLSNPAAAEYQLIGVYSVDWLVPMAKTLKRLGTKGAWIVHGSDGMDEITVSGHTHVAILKDGHIEEKIIRPSDFGLKESPVTELAGGDATENAQALKVLLNGGENAYRDIVLANSAAVLSMRGKSNDLKEAAQMAAEAIDSGKAFDVLEQYIQFTNSSSND